MFRKLIIVLIIFIVLSTSAWIFSSLFYTSKSSENEQAEETENGEALPDNPTRFEEIAHLSCEHEKPIIECDLCRYEVGVVKVHPSLLEPSEGRTSLLEIGTVQKMQSIKTIELGGEIQPDPNRVLVLRANANGVISSVKGSLGQSVSPDRILFEMDSNDYRELHLEFLRLNALLRLAEKDFERESRLFQKRLTTEKEFLEAQSEVERINIERDTTSRKLRLMGLSEKEVEELPNHSEHPEACTLPVRSSLNGIIVALEVAPGELVEANAELATVADYSALWVWVDIFEKDLALLQSAFEKGDVRAEVSVASYPDRTFSGKLDYLADQMDERTRTIKARIVLDNKERLLKGGMFAHCTLAIPGEKPALIIPQEALMKDGDEYFVFKQVGDDLFFKQNVLTEKPIAGSIEVLQGLQESDRIVIRGAFALKSDVLREKMGAGCAD